MVELLPVTLLGGVVVGVGDGVKDFEVGDRVTASGAELQITWNLLMYQKFSM